MNRFKRRGWPWQASHSAWVLLIFVGLGLALRLHRLGAQDIWGDEAFSISLSGQPLTQVVAGAADTHPPFYPLLLFFWLRLAGTLSFATRALSAFVGTLAIPLVFVFSRRLAPTRPRVAWFAVALVIVSPLLVYYSQETRMYELVAVLTLASMYLTLRIVERPSLGRLSGGLAYLLMTALALYTHYYAFFALAAENVFAVTRLRGNKGSLVRWGLLQAVLVAVYIPWVLVQSTFLGGKASGRFDEWGWRGIELIFGKTLLAFGAGLTLDFPAAHAAALCFSVLAIGGLVVILRERDAQLWLAAMYAGVPVFIAWLVNPILPFFYERFVLLALPGFYVLVAVGLDGLARRSVFVSTAAILALLAFSTLSLANYFYNDAYAKGKYGQMMAYVAGQAQPGDALILNNPLQKPLFNYYRPAGIPAFFLPDGAPLEDPATRRRLVNLAAEHPRLWLVMYGNPAEYDPTGYLQRWLGAHAFKSLFRGYVDAGLTLYVTAGGGEAAIRRPVHATLGDISLVSYELDRGQVSPGQTLRLTLHWQAKSRIDKRYTVFTHLISDPDAPALNPATGSPVWAQMDGEPAGGARPTTGWGIGEMIDDPYGLMLPASIPPGKFMLEVGMYDPSTLERLPVRDEHGIRLADDRILLDIVEVTAR